MKLKMLEHLNGAQSYEVGQVYEFSDKEAYNLINAGIAEAKTKKEHESFIQKMEEIKEEELEKEKRVAAILEKEELEDERAKLQERVDAITDILGDSVVYYKSYIDLASDLEKKGEGE